MAKALVFIVKESEAEIKRLIKSTPAHLSPRLRMLLICKKSETSLSKTELASLIGVNHNSVQKKGNRPSVVSGELHEQIKLRLYNPKEAFRSYKELQQWIDAHFIKGINYFTVNSYVKRHFGAKLKVARKSHINKVEEDSIGFKKTFKKSAKRK